MNHIDRSGQNGGLLGNLLQSFTGQQHIKQVLENAIEAAKLGKWMQHLCLFGPPGVGKTTIAQMISEELGTKCVKVDARSLKTVYDLINLTIGLKDNDVFFIDEIHGLDKNLEEQFYGLLDNQTCQLNVGGKIVPIHTSKFIMVGATTRYGEVSKPLQTRFGMVLELHHYSHEELSVIIDNKCKELGFRLTDDACLYVARVSRGTVRIAEKFITRIHDRVLLDKLVIVDVDSIADIMNQLGVDYYGLNRQDKEFLKLLKERFHNQPTGINTLAMSMGETEDNIMQTVEPFLVKSGFVMRTPRGRMLTDFGMEMV